MQSSNINNQIKTTIFDENGTINVNNLISRIDSELLQTNNHEQAMRNVFKEELKDLKDEIDIDSVINKMVENARPLLNMNTVNENTIINKILEDTLKNSDHTFDDTSIEMLKEFIPYDTTITIDGIEVFYKLSFILIILDEHKIAINQVNTLENESIEKRGIAKTRTKVEEAVNPRINTFKNANKFNNIPANELSLKLSTEFKNNPREINTILEYIDTSIFLNIDKSISDTFNNSKQFFNSSESVDDTHIFTSAQIYFFIMYKKENNPDVKDTLTNKNIADYINIILNDFFKHEYNSNLTRKHIVKPIQQKTIFNKLEILEYQTSKNIKHHPIFS